MGRINTKSKKENLTKTDNKESDLTNKKLIGKLELKTTSRAKQKSSAISKLKKNDELKSSLLKQVQSNAKVDIAAGESDLNFVKRPSVLNRLTNSALKQIINQANELSKKNDPKSASNRLKKTLKKTVKAKIKKDAWQKNIDSIKNQIKEKQAKQKREKTVIVGDVQPMIESLLTSAAKETVAPVTSTTLPQINLNSKQKKVSFNDDALFELAKIKESNAKAMSAIKSTREENYAKLKEREMNKSIQKQSIRNKKS